MTNHAPRQSSDANLLHVVQDGPNPTLIECLENLLADAKAGELQAMTYVCSWRSNLVSSGWTSRNHNRMRVIGELTQLSHHLCSLEPLEG